MFNLEKLERTIIVFLVCALLTGLAAAGYKKHGREVEVKVTGFEIQAEEKAAPDEGFRIHKKVNINEARLDELMTLKGVGTVLAGRIIDYRTSSGAFGSTEEIKKVKGIGPALFDKIKDDISIE